MSKLGLAAFVAVALVAFVTQTQASTITGSYEGTVTSAGGSLAAYVPVGSGFTVDFSYDDTVSNDGSGTYAGALTVFSVSFNTTPTAYHFGGSGDVQVANDTFGADGVRLVTAGTTTSDIPGFQPQNGSLILADFSGTIFNNDDLPSSPPGVTASMFTILSLGFKSGESSLTLEGSLTPMVVAAAPIPATLPLFASALGGLGFLGFRRRRGATAVA